MCRLLGSAGDGGPSPRELSGASLPRPRARRPGTPCDCPGALSSFLPKIVAGDALVRRGRASPLIVVNRQGAPSQPAPGPLKPATEDDVPGLIFNLQLHDDDDISTRSKEFEIVQRAELLKALVEPKTVEEQILLDSVLRLCVGRPTDDLASGGQCVVNPLAPEGASSLRALALDLGALGYDVAVRRAVGGGEGGECLKNLRHSFLRIRSSVSGASRAYIVDPNFRDQFTVHHPTPEYQNLLWNVPECLVAPEDRMGQLVTLLCAEMVQVFKHQGTIMPPWRKNSAMITKWRPPQWVDEIPPRSTSVNKSAEQSILSKPHCPRDHDDDYCSDTIRAVRAPVMGLQQGSLSCADGITNKWPADGQNVGISPTLDGVFDAVPTVGPRVVHAWSTGKLGMWVGGKGVVMRSAMGNVDKKDAGLLLG